MHRILPISVLSLCLLAAGQAGAASINLPPPGPIRCDPMACRLPGVPRPKPLYAANAECVLYLDRDVMGPQFHAGPVVKRSETDDRVILENSFDALAPEYQDTFSAIRCDDIPEARCHATLFADEELKGRKIEIDGSQGLVDLATLGMDNQVSSITLSCDVLKTPR